MYMIHGLLNYTMIIKFFQKKYCQLYDIKIQVIAGSLPVSP